MSLKVKRRGAGYRGGVLVSRRADVWTTGSDYFVSTAWFECRTWSSGVYTVGCRCRTCPSGESTSRSIAGTFVEAYKYDCPQVPATHTIDLVFRSSNMDTYKDSELLAARGNRLIVESGHGDFHELLDDIYQPESNPDGILSLRLAENVREIPLKRIRHVYFVYQCVSLCHMFPSHVVGLLTEANRSSDKSVRPKTGTRRSPFTSSFR